MARHRVETISIDRLNLGLRRYPPETLPPGALQIADNWLPEGDSLVTRPGYTRLTATPFASDITGLARIYTPQGKLIVVATLADGSVFHVEEPTGQPTPVALHSAEAAPWHFISFAGTLVGASGNAEPLARYNGLQWSTVAGAPRAAFLVEHNNRLIAAHTSDSPTALRFSEIGNPASWPSGHQLQFGHDDGDPITAVTSLFGILVVFKTKSVWTVVGTEPSNYLPLKLSGALGCIAPRSVAQVAGAVYFLSESGVWSFDGTRFRHRSDPVDHLLRQKPGLAAAAAAAIADRYVLAYSTTGAPRNDSALVYDPRADAWFNFTNHPFDIIEHKPRHDGGPTYAASNRDRHIYRLYDGVTDAGAPITARLRTGHLAHDRPNYYLYRRVRVRATRPGKPTLSLTVSAHRDDLQPRHSATVTAVGLPAFMHGDAVDIELVVTPDSGPVIVHGFEIERVRRRRR